MSLLQIQDPKEQQQDVVVGIDFGTTNSCIAFSENHKPIVLGNLLPSILVFDKKKWSVSSAGAAKITSIKRILGKNYNDLLKLKAIDPELKKLLCIEDEMVKIKIGDSVFDIVELASLIFSKLKNTAEKNLGQTVNKAVVSVPAYFDDKQKSSIKKAAVSAGLEIIRLIQEPTAAGFAYGINNDGARGQYLVYDFGGGTFDVSLLNIQGKIIQVIAVGGNEMLGGDDIDIAIADYLSTKYSKKVSLTTAKILKEKLESSAKIQHDNIELTATEYELIALPIIEKTIKITESLISQSDNLKGIILVGGSSKSSIVRKNLAKFGVKLLYDIDPDRAVALGAALQAENLSRSKSHVLIDVVPLSLGIEVMGGLSEKIIMRNTPIPVRIQKYFTTHVDNQNAIKFHIIQGEREFAKDCRSLGFFELKGISPMPAGMAKIEVNFMVDVDGLLYVTASEQNSQISQELVVEIGQGISDEQIANILKQSFENATSDIAARALQEQILKAQDLLDKVYKILSKLDGMYKLDLAIKGLEQAIDKRNLKSIDKAYKKLEAEFNPICLKHFNTQINKLLSSSKIKELA